MPAEPQPLDIERAIARLKSFQDDDLSILSVVAYGQRAVPALRAMLFEREPSGLYQPRCRAVEALAALGAYEILIEFLQAERTIADPIERLGEDAVINAAARGLAKVRQRRVFELLLRLAQRPTLTGVIGALGTFGQVEAIPVLIDALEDDASRLTAESALKKLGRPARAALLKAAAAISRERESESRTRQLRSALGLLAKMGIPRNAWPFLRPLLRDPDAKAAVLACQICLDHASVVERRRCARRLIELLMRDDWMLREDIEACLVGHLDSARQEIERYLHRTQGEDAATKLQIDTILRRVLARAQTAPQR